MLNHDVSFTIIPSTRSSDIIRNHRSRSYIKERCDRIRYGSNDGTNQFIPYEKMGAMYIKPIGIQRFTCAYSKGKEENARNYIMKVASSGKYDSGKYDLIF